MAKRISSSVAVKYLKLGDFEVEFQDTIACDPNGSQLGIQLYNLVVSNARSICSTNSVSQQMNGAQ